MISSVVRIGSICLAGMLALAAPAGGQSTQAAIIGMVTDTSGAILPGVTVSATGPALQVPQVDTVTNERGEYRLSPLPVGTYNITYELPGFQTVRREGVRPAVGFVATLDQIMSLGTVSETITVSGASPLVDVTNPATSVDLSSEGLEVLPATRDGLKAFMGQVPGMRTNLDVGASSMTDTIVIRAYGQQGAPWRRQLRSLRPCAHQRPRCGTVRAERRGALTPRSYGNTASSVRGRAPAVTPLGTNGVLNSPPTSNSERGTGTRNQLPGLI